MALAGKRIPGKPFLDISRLTAAGGERGLLGLAFHPDYARNGRFYVDYTNRAGDTRVVEYTRANQNRATSSNAFCTCALWTFKSGCEVRKLCR